MSRLILTLDEYAPAIDRHFHEAKKIARARQDALTRGIFRAWAMRRFEESAPKYGPLDLTSRNWIGEQSEESVDAIAYGIFELEAKARKL